MAGTPVPIKGQQFSWRFPIQRGDTTSGGYVVGAAGLDAEISKDDGTPADCTNAPVEIGNGDYRLILTATEMDADCVCVTVKSSTTGALWTKGIIYPQKPGDIKVDLETIKTQSVAAAAGVTFPAAIGTSTLTAGAVRTELATELARLDVDVSSRMATFSYTAPDNATLTAIAAKLPSSTYLAGSANADGSITVDVGEIEVEGLTEEQDAKLTTIYQRTAAGVSFLSPVLTGEAIELYRGFDYDADHGNALEWEYTGTANLTGATIHFRLGSTNLGTGSVPEAGRLRVEFTRAELAEIAPGKPADDYLVWATLADTHQIPLFRGVARLR